MIPADFRRVLSIDDRVLDHYFEISESGVILEPYSLEPGSHTAHIVYTWDGNRDGVTDIDFKFFTEFTIHEADATP